MRQEPDFRTLNTKQVQAKIRPFIPSDITETPPSLHKFSLSALCVRRELGEDAKRITDVYPQQALEQMATRPDAKFYIARQSTNLTQEERRRFMDAAFEFESYCLIFSRGQQLLYWRNEELGKGFFERNAYLWMRPLKYHNIVGRFYCIMYYMLHEYKELLSSVVGRLESVDGRGLSLPMGWNHKHKEEYFLHFFQFDPEEESDSEEEEHGVIYLIQAANYFHYLASQGLGMFTRLQKMSIEELTEFTVTTFWLVTRSRCPKVQMMDPDYLSGTRRGGEWLPWAHLDSILLVEWRDLDSDIWEDIWTRAVPFWGPSEDEHDPYGRRSNTKHRVGGWESFWFLDPEA
jgi:hypothetical protein